MKLRKRLVIILILILLITIGCYNYFIYNQDEQHQSYNLGIITLNTTNTTNLLCEVNETGFLRYVDDTGKYTISIISYDNMTTIKANEYKNRVHNSKDSPSKVVNGTVIYTTTANIGEYVGETRYEAMIENQDLNVTVDICTPDVKETVYIAKNTKFN